MREKTRVTPDASKGHSVPKSPIFATTPWLRALYALSVGFAVLTLCLQRLQPDAQWPTGVLLSLAFVANLASQSRSLPLQNVLAGALSIVVVSGIILTVNATLSFPFGSVTYPANGGGFFGPVPWWLPLLWVVVILNCRGVARLVLRPGRKSRTFGFRVIGLTAVLAMLFDLGLEPFATQVNHFWGWQPTIHSPIWFGSPWGNSVGWLVTSLVIQVLAAPWLINKRPVQFPPDHHPLGIWLAMNLFLGVTLLFHRHWLPMAAVSTATLVLTALAIRNARRLPDLP